MRCDVRIDMGITRSKVYVVGVLALGIAIAVASAFPGPAISFSVLSCTTNRLKDESANVVFGGRECIVALVAVTNHSNRSVTYSETISDEPGVEYVGLTGVRSVQVRNAHTYERVLSPGMGVTFKAIPNLYDRGLVFHYRDVRLIHRVWDRLPEFLIDWLPALSPNCAVQAEF